MNMETTRKSKSELSYKRLDRKEFLSEKNSSEVISVCFVSVQFSKPLKHESTLWRRKENVSQVRDY